MKRRWRKLAAALTVATLLLQSTVVPSAEDIIEDIIVTEIQTEALPEAQMEVQTEVLTEPQTQAPIEIQTEAPIEIQTEAPTEPQTQAPTEIQTEAPTEPQTQAPTEVQTEALTEPQTQAPTEVQTEALTEPQTQAPTEPQTEAPTETQTESQAEETETESETETETETETESETETERSERVNDGASVSSSDLAAKLESVLEYLIAAEEIIVSESMEEMLQDKLNEEADLSGLQDISVELANATAEDDLVVINLYADENGDLDMAQLDALFPDHKIDVTSDFYLINVIADSKEQPLRFSGFELTRSSARSIFVREAEPGEVLYNFAAMSEAEEFVGYEGNLILESDLEGTFLAPQAEVQVESDLSGAVYAGKVTVSDSVENLTHVVFVEGQEIETESETETETESETETETESETETETESETETETESETETETESETETETEQPVYMANVNITVNVKGRDGSEEATDEVFYVQFYADKALKKAVLKQPIAVEMDGFAARTKKVKLELKDKKATYYIAETNIDGTALGEKFAYDVTYPKLKEGAFSVENGKTTEVTVQNSLKDSVVKVGVVNNGKYLAGAVLVLKDAKGNIIEVNDSKTFTSGTEAIQWTNLLTDGADYYLSEVKAPEGYTVVSDTKFTVKRGGTTEVLLENQAIVPSAFKLTVNTQVYSGDTQVYAYDTTSGTHAANGAYTFYAALFADEARTKKISDVQTITISATGGSTTFQNLEANRTYYVAQTNQYGQVMASTDTQSIRYADTGKVQMDSAAKTTLIQNVYSSLPAGYRHTGTLTLTLNLKNAAGEALKGTETFYAGIFRTADYSDTPTVVQLSLQNSSTVSVRRRILLSGEEDMVYYIAEVDAQGRRITDDSGFGYKVTVDQPTVTISGGEDKVVTITNQVKTSKVTLYLTKKVYNGTSQQAVNDTFYAGLFKDPDFKEPYTKPVPMKMNGKSELTLKLSLNLGNADKATIYVAEVDANGNIIKNESEFGYEIKLVNSTVAFTQERTEIQTILINTVHGTVSTDDWQQILGSDGNDIPDGGYSYVTSNGVASQYDDSVQTGDETPIVLYIGLMAAALLVLLVVVFVMVARRRR